MKPAPALREMAPAAAAYRQHLNAVKQNAQVNFSWYPFDTLSNFYRLDQLQSSSGFDLFAHLRDGYVLDLGCGDGDSSFFLESLGYRAVAADYPPTNMNGMKGVERLKELLQSSVEIERINLDDRFSVKPRSYSLILFLGILYHLKNPFFALEYLSRIAPYCFLSTRTIVAAPDGRRLDDLPVAYLVGEREMNNDPTNYWAFTDFGLERIINRAGWNVLSSLTVASELIADPVNARGDQRTFVLLKSKSAFGGPSAIYGPGWYQREAGGWRWTARKFVIEFPLTPNCSLYTLEADVVAPDALFPTERAVQLSMKANGASLAPEVFTSPGPRTFEREISTDSDRSVILHFELDAAIPPSSADQRELGLIAVRMNLQPLR